MAPERRGLKNVVAASLVHTSVQNKKASASLTVLTIFRIFGGVGEGRLGSGQPAERRENSSNSTQAGRKQSSLVVQRSFPDPLSYSHKCPSPESDNSATQQVQMLFHGDLTIACLNQLFQMQTNSMNAKLLPIMLG